MHSDIDAYLSHMHSNVVDNHCNVSSIVLSQVNRYYHRSSMLKIIWNGLIQINISVISKDINIDTWN